MPLIRVYKFGELTAHIVPYNDLHVPALCEEIPGTIGWFGINSDRQVDKASRIKLCIKCEELGK